MKKPTLRGILLTTVSLCALLGTAARGAVFYADSSSFNAGIQAGSYTDGFESLSLDTSGSGHGPSLGFGSGAFSYTLSSPSDLWVSDGVSGAAGTDKFIGIRAAPGYLRIDFTGGSISAVGGYFVSLDGLSVPQGDLQITLSDGTIHNIIAPNANTFSGFIASSPISWMEIHPMNPATGVWPNMNDFTVGVSAVPEPGFTGIIAVAGLFLAVGLARMRAGTISK